MVLFLFHGTFSPLLTLFAAQASRDVAFLLYLVDKFAAVSSVRRLANPFFLGSLVFQSTTFFPGWFGYHCMHMMFNASTSTFN